MIRAFSILLLTCCAAIAQTPPPLPTNHVKRAVSNNPRIFTPQPRVIPVCDIVPTGTNFVFIIERSTNLVDWRDAAILPANYNVNQWTDTNPPNGAAFYRIVAVGLNVKK